MGNSSKNLPPKIQNEFELEELLSRPSPEWIEMMQNLEGDIMILGVGGKMGPTLARMSQRAAMEANSPKRIIGVSRFSESHLRKSLEQAGIETIACDLSDRCALEALPEISNILFLVGRKFGSVGQMELTWATNTYIAGMAAERFPKSRITALSTGNVYPLTPVAYGGSKESDPPDPVGEYAQSCLGRERMFQYYSLKSGMKCALIRLNYAVELRYGILLEIAQKVYGEKSISLVSGNVNVIWEGDVHDRILRSFAYCESPPQIINITGPETVSIRWLAYEFGKRFGKEPRVTDTEAESALLSNASQSMQLFGYPQVPLVQVMDWVADWVVNGGPTWNKPTKYSEREGKF